MIIMLLRFCSKTSWTCILTMSLSRSLCCCSLHLMLIFTFRDFVSVPNLCITNMFLLVEKHLFPIASVESICWLQRRDGLTTPERTTLQIWSQEEFQLRNWWIWEYGARVFISGRSHLEDEGLYRVAWWSFLMTPFHLSKRYRLLCSLSDPIWQIIYQHDSTSLLKIGTITYIP